MPHDELDYIPSIVPTRDSVPQRSSSQPKPSKGERSRNPNTPKQPPYVVGTGLLARLFITISLVAAMLACAWAWQLQTQLLQANEHIANYAARIGDLEARLSDTDEGMNQNAEVQAKKAAQLEAEVRKLWDNVWKESKDRFAKLEATGTSQGKSIKGMEGSLSTAQSQLKAAQSQLQETSDDITKLKSVSGDLARLVSSAKASQAEVERVADSLNRIDLALAKLDKRVAGNEEWVGSVNAFRKQINASLAELQATVRAMQASPG